MTDLALPQIFTPATASEWSSTLFANANKLKLRTSAWQPGGVTRTIFAVFANMLEMEDITTSILSQGGFLDYAATGTVTYTDSITGQPVTVYVTPDPSDPAQNPSGALGALDVLADSVYDVQRTLDSRAGGAGAILNTSASTYGPFSPGGYHVAQPEAEGSPGYSNTTTFSIPPSPIVGSVAAVVSSAGLIRITTSTPHGLTTGDTVFITSVAGVTAANGAWTVTVVDSTKFTLDGSTFSGSYTSGGTVYSPTVETFTADLPGTASDADDANLVTQPVTSLVGVQVRNLEPWLGTDIESNVDLAARCRLKLQSLSPNGPRGAYEFFAKSAQTLAPTLTPPLEVGTAITRALVQPNRSTGTVTVTIANQAGAPTSDDVTSVDAVIQAYCVPEGVTAFTQAAAETNVDVAMSIWVPSSYTATAKTTAETAIEVYFRLLQIGGVTDPGASPAATNVVPIDAVEGAVYAALAAANIPIQDSDITLNGVNDNVQLDLTPVPEVAVLGTNVVTATGI